MRIILLFLMFVYVAGLGVCITQMFRHQFLKMLLYAIMSCITFALMAHFMIRPKSSLWLIALALLVIVIDFGLIYLFMKEDRQAKSKVVGDYSIKESIDNLPMAVLFALPNGRVILENRAMSRLAFNITGADIYNANEFWETIAIGSSDNAEVVMGSGNIFKMERTTLDSYRGEIVQIMGSDISDIYRLADEASEKNKQLDELHNRLKLYMQNVDEITRAKERLNAKMQIHNELGRNLLSTRQYLKTNDGDVREVVVKWNNTVGMLKSGEFESNDERSIKKLLSNAKGMGIDIIFEGETELLDSDNEIMYYALVEMLNNSIRHGKADKLYIFAELIDEKYEIRFTNNGEAPEKKIIEGGGLSALRRRVEQIGGKMTITSMPRFVLELLVPAGGSGL